MGIYFATDIDRINNEYMPRLNLEIGRYINYSKLESMLSTQTLFFCNASRFDDEYEGEIPLECFDGTLSKGYARLEIGTPTDANTNAATTVEYVKNKVSGLDRKSVV